VVRIPQVPWYGKLEAGPSWHKPYLDILLLWKAIGEVRTFRPHLIHAHLHEGTLIGAVLKFLFQLPLLFDYQGSLSGESLNHGFIREASLLSKLFKKLERFIDSLADHIISSSDNGRQELIYEWGIAPDKVTNFADGVDTEIFRPFPESKVRYELGIPDNVKLVVYLGLFNKYQGVDLLLDAITIVKAALPDVRFMMMGFPDLEYRRKAVERGIDDVITFTGRVPYDRAPYYLNAGDLAVSPKLALTEANGKLFNYMACGLPTVVFENQVNREILGEDGVYVEHGNTSLLAEAIMTTIQNDDLMDSMSKRVRERAIVKHSWKIRSRQLESVYRTLLASKSKTGEC
jgi:glycosyltransferase involved in cell wall biosynthesis